MFGLEFIVKEHNMEYKEVAERIGVSKQTMQDWIKKRRRIPPARLAQLSQLFDVDQKLFQADLSNLEMLELQMSRIKRNAIKEVETIDDTYVDENGEELTGKVHWNPHLGEISEFEEDMKRQLVEEQFRRVLEERFALDGDIKLLSGFLKVIERNESGEINLLNKVVSYLNQDKRFFDIEAEKPENRQFYIELERCRTNMDTNKFGK